MGFLSHRQKNVELRPEQKWDYITLKDFKSTSCWTPFAYVNLYLSLILSTTVYTLDTFTAVNLLVFNKWSSEISPAISFTVAKWIFSICIILSFLNLTFEHVRAQLIMRRGSVTECYLDSLAVRLESIRWGKGQGWKRFLVFASLTKSKKGAEYIALFTYFSLQSWIRVLLCSGPRQVVNALTLYSVYNAKLSAKGDNVGKTLLNFFENIRDLAEENYQQALILSAMLFTLIIWVFSFLSLLMAFLFFVFYLWSYIPKSDGSLSAYCSRKISKRLMQIVSVKVNAALADEERRRKKAELKAAKKAGELPPPEHKATIPNVGPDKLPSLPKIERTDTMATLPPYTSRPGTPGGFELSAIDQKRALPSRSGTMGSIPPSNSSNYSARAPLLGFAAEPGMSNARSASPAHPARNLSAMSDSGFGNSYPRSPMRTGTGGPNNMYGGGPGAPPMQLNRTNTAGSMAPGTNTGVSNIFSSAYTSSPAMFSEKMPNMPNIAQRVQSPAPYANMPNHRPTGSNSSNRFVAYQDGSGRSSPAPSTRSYRPAGANPPNGPSGAYGAFSATNGPNGYSNDNVSAYSRDMSTPVRSATNPVQQWAPQGGPIYEQRFAPQRNMTAPVPSYGHQHHNSNESYASYFELPTPAPAQQPAQSQSAQSNDRWRPDLESQNGPGRY